MKKTVLVFGANGFVGAHLIRELQCKGEFLTIASDISFQHLNPILRNIEHTIVITEMDLLDHSKLIEVFKEYSPAIIINCAAYGVNYDQQNSILATRINVEAPIRLIELSAQFKVARYVHIGSAYEYGNKHYPITEKELLEPNGIYGASKAAGSLFLLERARSLGVELNILRPFGMWGPGEGAHKIVPQIIHCLDKNTVFKMTMGEQLRDYVYIKDMAQWIVAIALRENFNNLITLNLGSGNPVTLKVLVLAIARIMGKEHLVKIGALPYRANEMMSLVADITLQRKILGNPILTPISVGINEMLKKGGLL